jgi:hypothetical protein
MGAKHSSGEMSKLDERLAEINVCTWTHYLICVLCAVFLR